MICSAILNPLAPYLLMAISNLRDIEPTNPSAIYAKIVLLRSGEEAALNWMINIYGIIPAISILDAEFGSTEPPRGHE